jgi:hypothetical protein
MGPFRNALAVFCSAFFWLGSGPALADHRVALVIGNSDYKNVARLANPVNDAALVAEMFSHAGFEKVTIKLNLDLSGMRKALREFGASVRDAEVAAIYYAGHGIELDGNNYLIPTDAVLKTDTDVLDETLSLERVLFAVEPARQLKLIILDACRDNPFARTMKRTMATRGIGRGLARTEPNSSNTMIAFAARAGSTASDGDSANSPFTRWSITFQGRASMSAGRSDLCATTCSGEPETSRSHMSMVRWAGTTSRLSLPDREMPRQNPTSKTQFEGTTNWRFSLVRALDGRRSWRDIRLAFTPTSRRGR